ncbi:MAG: primosomal protein N' [Planctomycetota bacterium]
MAEGQGQLFAGSESEPAPAPDAALAAIAPDLPILGEFTYSIPARLEPEVQVGVRVRVPFGGRRVLGYVLETGPGVAPPPGRVRPLEAVLDREPVVAPDVLALARWVARYYRAPLGEVLSAAVPRAVGKARRDQEGFRLLAAEAPARLGDSQRRALELLADGPKTRKALGAAGVKADALRRLVSRGLIEPAQLSPRAAPLEPVERDTPPELTDEQALALRPILAQLEQEGSDVFLLHGVTGSGKTEVYLRAIARILELGRSAIVLVPEIALTPQTVSRFRARFGDQVALLHSQLSERARQRAWERLRAGELRVAIGPRSAVWAPVRDLGLIVVDEEHESTYKQEGSPRYQARDVAVVRGKQTGATVVLGSATPSLESYRNAQEHRYRLVRLRERPGSSELPRVVVVDMGREWAEVRGMPLFSRVLLREIERALAAKERVLLFQNRRGFHTFLQCPGCGHVMRCHQCDVTLTYHRGEAALLCHFCDARHPAPGNACPECKGPPLRARGSGTERVRELLAELFPQAKVGRLDTDVVRGGETPEQVLARFRAGDVDVLVGTQMIAKGLDVPELTCVGVISADTSLSLPDFRSAERTYQLVSQVAGRAGRGSSPGCTVVQTLSPRHFAITAAAEHRYEPFADEELRARHALRYPPFARLLKVLFRGPDAKAVEAEAEAATAELRAAEGEDPDVWAVLGPAPSPRAYLAGKFRFQCLIKGSPRGVRVCLELLERRKRARGVDLVTDVDPYNLL